MVEYFNASFMNKMLGPVWSLDGRCAFILDWYQLITDSEPRLIGSFVYNNILY